MFQALSLLGAKLLCRTCHARNYTLPPLIFYDRPPPVYLLQWAHTEKDYQPNKKIYPSQHDGCHKSQYHPLPLRFLPHSNGRYLSLIHIWSAPISPLRESFFRRIGEFNTSSSQPAGNSPESSQTAISSVRLANRCV